MIEVGMRNLLVDGCPPVGQRRAGRREGGREPARECGRSARNAVAKD